MAIERRFCHHHPDRPAIGVCVVLGIPICAECSTRYEGVNYSREGLRILQERRGLEAAHRPRWRRLSAVVSFVLAPVLFYLLYLSYLVVCRSLIDLAQEGL